MQQSKKPTLKKGSQICFTYQILATKEQKKTSGTFWNTNRICTKKDTTNKARGERLAQIKKSMNGPKKYD